MTFGINGDNSVNYKIEPDTTIAIHRPQLSPEDLAKIGKKLGVGSNAPSGKGLTIEPQKPTEDNLAARQELDKKVSSTDISYGDANKKIDEIRAKYNDDKYYDTVMEEQKQPENIAVYIPPREVRKFNPSKLPEPDRSEYRDAVNAKKEIENNNSALVKKAGPAVKHDTDKDVKTPALKLSNANLKGFEKILGKFVKKTEPTEEQKAATNKLNDKTSSTGVKYKDAKATLSEITKKYENNPACESEFESEQPKDGRLIYIAPYKAFDPYKLPEPDRTAYFNALEAATEIEQQNSALVAKAGTGETQKPSRNYHRPGGNVVLY